MMDFSRAVEFVLDEEGGYSNDPQDPGGETKFGISKRAYPNLDIANLTRDQAIAIYQRDYWDRLPTLPGRLQFLVFDFAVNAGIRRAVQTLQSAIGVSPDGYFGPVSRSALRKIPEITACVLFTAERANAYGHFAGFPRFGRGWMRRTVRAFHEATKDA